MMQYEAVTPTVKEVFNFSEKSLDLIAAKSKIDIAEGTARSSKSTTVMFKLGMHINNSDYNQFFIAGSTSGVARRNLVDNKNGFLEMFKGHVRDGTNPKYSNHLIFTDDKGREKIIYIFGFRDKARWQIVLGSTMGGGVIDEINTADPMFVKEVYRSLISVDNFWLGATLNPDNPDKEIYTELINRTRPLKKWAHDIPSEIIHELKKIPANEVIANALYWHFGFHDNPTMTADKVDFFKQLYPVGSFYYNSKILGLRGVTEGVIFGKYLTEALLSQMIEAVWDGRKQPFDEIEYAVKTSEHIRYSIGVDLGNNELKRGTIVTLTGVKRGYKGIDAIEAYQARATEANALVLEICREIIRMYSMLADRTKFEGVWIDGYGSVHLLIPTIRKQLNNMGYPQISVDLAIKFGDEGGRNARMMLLLLLITQGKVKFNNKSVGVRELFKSLKKIVYNEKDGLPLDNNQLEMDYYDSFCYSFTPFTVRLNNEVTQGALNL